MQLLATMDGVTIAQWVFNALIFIANIVFGIILSSFSRKNQEIIDLKTEIKKSAEDYLKERFAVIGREMTGHLEPVLRSIDEMAERLKEGERAFGGLTERDHQVELKMVNLLGQLKDSMRACYTSREDFDRWEKHVNGRFDTLNRLLLQALKERRNG